jgi:hypothetical protein
MILVLLLQALEGVKEDGSGDIYGALTRSIPEFGPVPPVRSQFPFTYICAFEVSR